MPLYQDGSITTIDGAFTVNDDPVDVVDGSEWPASNFTIKVWDQDDPAILKAVIYVGTRTSNALSNVAWSFGGHTDVNLADGDYVALEIAAPNFPPPVWTPATVGAYDDPFYEDRSADWTAVAPDSGTQTWSYHFAPRLGTYRGAHVLQANSSSAGDGGAYLKSVSGIATGDYVQGAFAFGRRYNNNDTAVGICMTNGTTTAAAVAGGAIANDNGAIDRWLRLTGTLAATTLNDNFFRNSSSVPIHQRLVYSASNTFQHLISTSGEAGTFLQIGSDLSVTMTPTHAGFFFLNTNNTGAVGHGLYFHSNITP